MRDDLARIESQYGCVAEYNRSMAEEDNRNWEYQERLINSFKKAKEREKAALDAGYHFIAFGNTFCDKCILAAIFARLECVTLQMISALHTAITTNVLA